MADHPSKTVILRDARLIFRNFSGLEREFNSEGDRNFSVILEKDTALKMIEDGWRVKQLRPREDDEEGDYHLKVKVNYKKGRPPRVVLISSSTHTDLGQDEVSMLDIADLQKVDLVINGWWSDMAGGGYGGFLKTMMAHLNEDELEKEYALAQDATEGLKKLADEAPVMEDA